MGESIGNGQLTMDSGVQVLRRAEAICDGLMGRCPHLQIAEVRALSNFFAEATSLSLLTPDEVVARVASVALQQYVALTFLSPRVQMHDPNHEVPDALAEAICS